MESWLYRLTPSKQVPIACLPMLSPVMLQADQCLPTLYLSPFSRCSEAKVFVASLVG
ncbi:hypothetical protein BOKEGFJH_00119 [Chlamydia avium]|uniref:Uncharacterized protein n=2 Tax=Chlamydia avium TaxID=1457141 RepID=W8JQ66_9CHLA|nr:hypothetical protein [Chlamydia avium]AHK62993.1 Uncharacterized protein M832_01240 [Chlamydia avium 10DC88]EPP35939.1 hypothetical protein CP10743SC13_0445 [Chlamydia psittaci 10_743_SC13]EPP38207.1 hypothetical protein CP10881SC42_0530 [Chlamydia avium]VVT42609.1 hypothetical protein BOKEGFJH_00119 [Chlamydia avium]